MDLYIDEWVYELLDLIEATKATRVVVDSLGDLLLASADPIRFRELLHSLVQRCARQGVSLLFTLEVAELFDATRISDVGVSHLSDNVVVLQYHQVASEVKRSLTVLKTRASDHTPTIREYHISSAGIDARRSHRPPVGRDGAARRPPTLATGPTERRSSDAPECRGFGSRRHGHLFGNPLTPEGARPRRSGGPWC